VDVPTHRENGTTFDIAALTASVRAGYPSYRKPRGAIRLFNTEGFSIHALPIVFNLSLYHASETLIADQTLTSPEVSSPQMDASGRRSLEFERSGTEFSAFCFSHRPVIKEALIGDCRSVVFVVLGGGGEGEIRLE